MTAIRPQFHLAQVNVARARAALSSPVMEGFASAIEAMNRHAESSPGFVWRLKGSSEADAETIRLFEDPLLLVTLSVWESPDALRAFAYEGAHGTFFRRREEWFQSMDTPNYALWWIPARELPTLAEAHQRLAHLAANGPTATAFGFAHLARFPAPSAA
jgi:heme-degrading monooxygenase HmoA